MNEAEQNYLRRTIAKTRHLLKIIQNNAMANQECKTLSNIKNKTTEHKLITLADKGKTIIKIQEQD
jgi:hypothetical protein